MANRRVEWIRKNSEKLISGKYKKKIGTAYANTFIHARDLEYYHGTYQFEQQMLDCIRRGSPRELNALLMGYTDSNSFEEGKVAQDDLRQAKNIFIALVAMVGKTAAIPGGMPIEQAYTLIDTYTQQCESLNNIEDVYILQYGMVTDFAERVRNYRFTTELSPLIKNCTDYIILHLNEPITSRDVIQFSGISKASLCSKFKVETGSEIGTFITKCKIDEAKALLRYTGRSLSEISEYLSFSSQPYFQKVFKKVTGLTPGEYRSQSGQ